MHVVGRHRAGRADEEDGVNDRLKRLPRARGGSFQFGELVDMTIHSVFELSVGCAWGVRRNEEREKGGESTRPVDSTICTSE